MIQSRDLDLRTAQRLTNGSANDFLTLGSFNHFKFRSHASHWGKEISFLHTEFACFKPEVRKRNWGEDMAQIGMACVLLSADTKAPRCVPRGRLRFFTVTSHREDFDLS